MRSEAWQQHAFVNFVQSLALLGAMCGLFALLGWIVWGREGLIGLVFVTLSLFAFHPSVSPRMIMAMYGARRLEPHQAPFLHEAVVELAERAGLEDPPALYYLPSGLINAFAVGTRRRAAIGLTDGFLRAFDQREALGVLAHEISHIRSNDLWVMGAADLFSRLTSTLSLVGQLLLVINLPLVLLSEVSVNWWAIVLLIMAPNLSALAQFGLSRTREYHADLHAVQLTQDAEGLARALLKIERFSGSWLERIIFPGRRNPEPSLLRTHPPTAERVRRLRELQPGGPHALGMRPARAGDVLHPGGGRVIRPPRWHVGGVWY